jgi:IS605 OrfB family transposase
VWFKLSSLGDGIVVKLPSRKHGHMLKLLDQGYLLKMSSRLRRVGGKYFLDLYAEKQAPEPKQRGLVLGIDTGYYTLLADSFGNEHGLELEAQYERIARKRQNSKAFKRALKERDNLINRTVNRLDLTAVKTVVVEALKNVKRPKKDGERNYFMNKLQRWSYPKVLGKLARVCEELGVGFERINPAYTSQTCSSCGHVDRDSRQGKSFVCVACGFEMDADLNAAVNIRNRGVYSLPALQPIL